MLGTPREVCSVARPPTVIETRPWKVTSVSVKTRDGPGRLEQAYRILLSESSKQPDVAVITNVGDKPGQTVR
jgi:hypothetical protein